MWDAMTKWIHPSPGLSLKPEPATWVTWLAKPLADPAHCLVPLYVQSRFKIVKEDFYMGDWAAKHSAIMESLKERMMAKGREVELEKEIAITSKTGITIVGSIDVWSPELNGMAAVAADAKTGKPKPSDRLQVTLYQLMARASPDFALSVPPIGLVKYHTGKEIWLRAEQAGTELAVRLSRLMKIVAADDPPVTSPSFSNCRFCPLRHLCPDALTQQRSSPITSLF